MQPRPEITCAPSCLHESPNELRIALRRTKPPIWRRVLVPPSMRLDTLHDLIQVVMGWEDCHLHMFMKAGQRYSIPSPWNDDFRMPVTPLTVTSARTTAPPSTRITSRVAHRCTSRPRLRAVPVLTFPRR